MKILRFFKTAVLTIAAVAAVGMTAYTDAYAKDADGDYVVVIDPGHGAKEPGASSLGGGIEATFNWNIAVALKAELESYSGVKVYLTRGSAEPFSNSGRAHVGENLGADLAISIHNNSGGAGNVSGVQILGNVNPQFASAMTNLGNLVIAEISPYVGNHGFYNRTSQFTEGGTPVNFYTFIDEATKAGYPSIMIEHCFLDHAGNSAFINQLSNQYKLGYGDATAIAKYFGLSKRTVAVGGSVNLIRTYSAKITGATGGYASSNESVAKVSADGLITAVGAGSATITTNAGKVNVTVPAVKQIALAAGITPTMYSTKEQFDAINKGMTTVKAIYSDGTAIQVNGASIGASSIGPTRTYNYSDGTSTVTQINTPVSYNGFTCTLKTYYGPRLTIGNYSQENYAPYGTNQDVVHIPGSYTSAANGSLPTVKPTQAPATQAPTKAPTQATTVLGTEATTVEFVENPTGGSSETTSQVGTEMVTQAAADVSEGSSAIPVLIGLIAVLGIGLIGGLWLAIRRR